MWLPWFMSNKQWNDVMAVPAPVEGGTDRGRGSVRGATWRRRSSTAWTAGHHWRSSNATRWCRSSARSWRTATA